MLENTIKTGRNDLKTLLRDAQEMFRDATNATGSKADDLRNKGLGLLDVAIEKAQDAQSAAVSTGREFADTADEYVRANPWTSIAVVAGVALTLGILLNRK